MKKNTLSALFLSFLMASLVSCSGTTTTESTSDSTAIETTTTEVANPAFETLLNEFATCDDLEKFLKNETCAAEKEYKDAEGKTKIESLATQILAITGENAGVKNFVTEDFLKGILTYEDGGDMGTYTLSGLSKAYWEDLVFVSFMIETSASPMVNQSSTVLVFTKTGEFKEAFTNYYYSSGSQANSSTSITSVEKAESLKLMLKSIEEGKDGTADEMAGDFYLIAKDGTVSYDDSQKK
jgi:hypothetical protein